ncbi:MAG: type III pantothenate kinase [bacterium]|nr:type III pantothenate kinase [bacterium]
MQKVIILIGNTNTRIAYLTEKSIKRVFTIKTKQLKSVLKGLLLVQDNNFYLASVVPEASTIVKSYLPAVKEITWRDFPGKIKVKKPERVGIDRLLNAVGAWHLVKSECMIIDAGSAITIDFVNRNGDFEGGVIFPGEHLIIESLKNLALLKSVKISKRGSIIGKDTSEAIGSGIVYGIPFLVSGYINFFKAKNPRLSVFFTGGAGRTLQQKIKHGFYNKNLAIIGIRKIIYGCS